MSKKNNGFGKFLLGATIGAGIALLFTKKTGKENREALKNKANELVTKVKSIDSKELKENILAKVDEIMVEISELDKEKVLKIAKKKAQDIKEKASQLVEYAVEKSTLDIVRYLFEESDTIKIEQLAKDHIGLLSLAIKNNDFRILRYLVESQNFDITNYKPYSCLYHIL